MSSLLITLLWVIMSNAVIPLTIKNQLPHKKTVKSNS